MSTRGEHPPGERQEANAREVPLEWFVAVILRGKVIAIEFSDNLKSHEQVGAWMHNLQGYFPKPQSLQEVLARISEVKAKLKPEVKAIIDECEKVILAETGFHPWAIIMKRTELNELYKGKERPALPENLSIFDGDVS